MQRFTQGAWAPLAAWLLGERLSAWQWLGGGVLMLSVGGLERRGARAMHP